MRVEVFYCENEDEWVLRLHDNRGGYVSIGALNGEEEAKVIRAVLQGAWDLYQSCRHNWVPPGDRQPRHERNRGMSMANNIVQGARLETLLEMQR